MAENKPTPEEACAKLKDGMAAIDARCTKMEVEISKLTTKAIAAKRAGKNSQAIAAMSQRKFIQKELAKLDGMRLAAEQQLQTIEGIVSPPIITNFQAAATRAI